MLAGDWIADKLDKFGHASSELVMMGVNLKLDFQKSLAEH